MNQTVDYELLLSNKLEPDLNRCFFLQITPGDRYHELGIRKEKRLSEGVAALICVDPDFHFEAIAQVINLWGVIFDSGNESLLYNTFVVCPNARIWRKLQFVKSSSQTSIVSLDQGVGRMGDGWILRFNLDVIVPLVKG